MAVQTEQVRDLVDFSPEGFLVTSFYLDVNAATFTSADLMHTSIDSAMHAAEEKRREIAETISHDADESIRADLRKIEQFLKHDFQRDDANAVAIFSCSAQDFWQVFSIPTPGETRIEFGPRPVVAPLAAFLSHSKPTVILLTDRQYGRIFTMEHGEVKEWTDFEAPYTVRRSDQGGWSQMRYQRRADNWAKHHIDHVAELALKLNQHMDFDWIILGVQEQYESEVMDSLHPYLKDRVIGTIYVRIDADVGQILDEARKVREDAETNLINDLIQRVQEYAGAGGKGTIGLEETIQALNEKKVHILLVQEGFSAPGAVCPSCGLLIAHHAETCPACNEPVQNVDDVVAAAIQRGFELTSRVEVATEQNQLEPINCIGSILYY